MRHLSTIVQIAALSVLDAWQHLALGGSVALQLVCDDHPRNVLQSFQQLAEKPLGRGGVAPALDQDVEDATVLVDGAPKIMLIARGYG